MRTSTITFRAVDTGLFIRMDYDTGWNDSLKCSGVGSWEDIIPFVDGKASVNFGAVQQWRGCTIVATQTPSAVTVIPTTSEELDFDGVSFCRIDEQSFSTIGPITQVYN